MQGNRRNKRKTRTRERKKEKNCELGVFGGTSDFNIFFDGTLFLTFWDFVLRPGSKNLYFHFVTNYCILIYKIVKFSRTLLSLNLSYIICYSVQFGYQIYVTSKVIRVNNFDSCQYFFLSHWLLSH